LYILGDKTRPLFYFYVTFTIEKTYLLCYVNNIRLIKTTPKRIKNIVIVGTEAKAVKLANTQYVSQYVTELRQKVGIYLPWIPEYAHDVEQFYTILESDAAVSHALNLVALMSSGEFYEVETEDKQLGKIIVKGLGYIRWFNQARKSMVQKAVLYGLSVQKKTWKKVTWRDFPGMVWEVPVELAEVDRRRMRIERDPNDRTKIWWTMYCPKLDMYVKLEDRKENPQAPLANQDYIWTQYEREEMSPYLKGIGETLYSLVYMKNKALQYWAELAEKWGTPFLVGTINTAAATFNSAMNAGSGTQDAVAIMSNFLEILENMRSRHVAVKPTQDEITIHEAGNAGQNIIHQLIEYVDNKMQLLILGAELTTIAPSVGSYALGQTHKGITHTITTYNKNLIEEELERDLVKDFLIRNKYNLLALDIDFPEPGEYKIKLTNLKERQQEEMLEQIPPSQQNLKELGM